MLGSAEAIEGGRIMKYPPAVYPLSSVCPLDLAISTRAIDQEPVCFFHVGPLDMVEVVGVPVLICPVCRERTYDMSLLARIEVILKWRTALGPCRTRYVFKELAAQLEWAEGVCAAPQGTTSLLAIHL